jgi:hypothetical protein
VREAANVDPPCLIWLNKRSFMKTLIRLSPALKLAIVVSFLAESNSLGKGGINRSVGTPVKTIEEAEQLPVGSQVTLACAKCETILTTRVDQRRSFLVWFEPKTTHECPGCGGYTTVFTIGNPGHGLYGRYYTHTCSICGPYSAVSYSNAPGHKLN